jgi:hypothetical protein
MISGMSVFNTKIPLTFWTTHWCEQFCVATTLLTIVAWFSGALWTSLTNMQIHLLSVINTLFNMVNHLILAFTFGSSPRFTGTGC